MNDEGKIATRESAESWLAAVASAATVLVGALIVSIGIDCIVWPCLVYEGLGSAIKVTPDVLALYFCIGLLFIGAGSLVIWLNR
jgi:hypothetical protein